eukprot:3027692-Amphidinium_carterae.1
MTCLLEGFVHRGMQGVTVELVDEATGQRSTCVRKNCNRRVHVADTFFVRWCWAWTLPLEAHTQVLAIYRVDERNFCVLLRACQTLEYTLNTLAL